METTFVARFYTKPIIGGDPVVFGRRVHQERVRADSYWRARDAAAELAAERGLGDVYITVEKLLVELGIW